MAITRETAVDKIESMEDGCIQVRTATRLVEDGAVINTSYHRHWVEPSTKTGEETDLAGNITKAGTWGDTDISGEDARVQAIANATWTDSVKTAFQEARDALQE